MKKVINGKLCDTEKSEYIGERKSHAYPGDFRYFKEALYKTQAGNWIVAGEGGPLTQYAQPLGNGGWTGGKGMRVLTEAEALEWAEDSSIKPDELAALFAIKEG